MSTWPTQTEVLEPHANLLGRLGKAVSSAAEITGGTIDGVTIGGTTRATAITTSVLTLAGNKAYSGSTSSNPVLSASYATTGTTTASSVLHNPIAINDSVSNTSGSTYAFSVTESVQANALGVKTAIYGHAIVAGNPGGTATNSQYVGVLGRADGNVNAGGGSGTEIGSVWGANFYAATAAAATYYQQMYGIEIDMSALATTGAPKVKIGLLIAHAGGDSTNGSSVNCAINLASQGSTTAKWSFGLQFGQTSKTWPFNSSSTLIGNQNPGAANIGIDLTGITFSSNQYQGPGFAIGASGPGAFAAGDKYLIIDASGNVHVSALGPAS